MKGILLTDTGSLKVVNGSLAIGETTAQNQRLLIFANKGEYKSKPMRGVGASVYLESDDTEGLARAIRTEFIADGMKVNTIKIGQNNALEIDAYYGN
jgi:PhoPQ-activated pathogenicity-related protein